MRKVSFIILNYNVADAVIRLVDSLLGWTDAGLEKHIIVVDNCSTDGSFAVLSGRYGGREEVDVLLTERNGGYSYGNNFGARYAMEKYRSDYLAISNPDIMIDEDTFDRLLDTFDLNSRIAAAAPVMKTADGGFSVNSKRLPSVREDIRMCRAERQRMGIINKSCRTVGSDGKETELLHGSFFVTRADYFAEVGMLDEKVFLYYEEFILGARMKAHGYKMVLRTGLFYRHEHSASLNKALDKSEKQRLNLRSRLYYHCVYNRANILELALLHHEATRRYRRTAGISRN